MSKLRCAVVTGANKGIGFEISKQLASNGIQVVLTARDVKRGEKAVADLRSRGYSDVIFHQLDVMNEESAVSLAKFIKSHFGKLDILVNNAGIGGVNVDWEAFHLQRDQESSNIVDLLKKLTTETYEMSEECVETNYFGTKRVTEALLTCLLSSDSGKIVNISATIGQLKSIPGETIREVLSKTETLNKENIDELVTGFLKDFKNGTLVSSGWPMYLSAYTVSKAAVNAYSRVLAKENPTICVNCVCPGFVKTDMNSNMGILTVEVGAKGPVWLASFPKDAPSGQFYQGLDVSTF